MVVQMKERLSTMSTSKAKLRKTERIKKQIEEAKKRDKAIEQEIKRAKMSVPDLVKDLRREKLGFMWKLWVYCTRHFTNQVLLVFEFDKLNTIFEGVKKGDTKIFTHIEENLLEDYKKDNAKTEELELEALYDLPEKEKSRLAARSTKTIKLILGFYQLVLNIILSNSSFFCYLFMVVCMIMNGSFLSTVYPISIFIYSILEEKRPTKKYWIIILYFTSIVLVLKFLMQTYPVSLWVTSPLRPTELGAAPRRINTISQYFRTWRLGLENLDESGRDFVEYFLFETFILLSVTLHIFVLIFGGVWIQREIEAESIDQGAARISASIKEKRVEEELKIRRKNKSFKREISDLDIEEEVEDEWFDEEIKINEKDPNELGRFFGL